MSTDHPALDVFFSYSHKDEALRDRLETHLSPLKRRGLVRTWHDRKIGAGREWAGQIDDHLKSAHIILLLVSPDFTASDYCWDVEVERALARHESGEARVIPIVLRPVDWQDTPFAKLQALPKDAKPVVSWSNPDDAFLDVAKGIRKAIEDEMERRRSGVAGGDTATMLRELRTTHAPAGAAGAGPAALGPAQVSPAGAGGGALAVWRKKLAFLQVEEAKADDAGKKFAVQEQIEEAKRKIQELGG